MIATRAEDVPDEVKVAGAWGHLNGISITGCQDCRIAQPSTEAIPKNGIEVVRTMVSVWPVQPANISLCQSK
jgi:hypothetical protein